METDEIGKGRRAAHSTRSSLSGAVAVLDKRLTSPYDKNK